MFGLPELLVLGSLPFIGMAIVEFILVVFLLGKEKYWVIPFTIVAVLTALYFFSGTTIPDAARWIWENPWQAASWVGIYFAVGTIYAVIKWWLFNLEVRDENREVKRNWLDGWQNKIQSLHRSIAAVRRNIEHNESQLKTVVEPGFGGAEQRTQLERKTEIFKKEAAKYEAELAIWTASGGQMTAELLLLWKEVEQETGFEDWFGRHTKIQKPKKENYKARIFAWIGYWPPSLFWTLLHDPVRRVAVWIYRSIAGILDEITDFVWQDEDKTL